MSDLLLVKNFIEKTSHPAILKTTEEASFEACNSTNFEKNDHIHISLKYLPFIQVDMILKYSLVRFYLMKRMQIECIIDFVLTQKQYFFTYLYTLNTSYCGWKKQYL